MSYFERVLRDSQPPEARITTSFQSGIASEFLQDQLPGAEGGNESEIEAAVTQFPTPSPSPQLSKPDPSVPSPKANRRGPTNDPLAKESPVQNTEAGHPAEMPRTTLAPAKRPISEQAVPDRVPSELSPRAPGPRRMERPEKWSPPIRAVQGVQESVVSGDAAQHRTETESKPSMIPPGASGREATASRSEAVPAQGKPGIIRPAQPSQDRDGEVRLVSVYEGESTLPASDSGAERQASVGIGEQEGQVGARSREAGLRAEPTGSKNFGVGRLSQNERAPASNKDPGSPTPRDASGTKERPRTAERAPTVRIGQIEITIQSPANEAPKRDRGGVDSGSSQPWFLRSL